MAEVMYGQGFELYYGMEEIRAVWQMLIWQGFWLFFLLPIVELWLEML
ncbi:MAG: hypothetical protein F6K54_40405 [Okeania sp. SIO3B5]|nr:hypothetical protein [Okeania sp. SIO3B5]NEO58751.1 hypothetical protein [Okeania sp. SIO3B5]